MERLILFVFENATVITIVLTFIVVPMASFVSVRFFIAHQDLFRAELTHPELFQQDELNSPQESAESEYGDDTLDVSNSNQNFDDMSEEDPELHAELEALIYEAHHG